MNETIIRVNDAHFVRDGLPLIAPFSIALAAGEHASLVQSTTGAAKIAARIAAAIVKPTSGSVFVGDFDARLQPAQAKRLVGFVPSDGFCANARAFEREVGFRADVWNVDRAAMQRNADGIYGTLEGLVEESWARAVALALAPDVRALVLENPSDDQIGPIAALRPHLALLAARAA